jgi:leader peptidase (prepilin peptidase)/N-methyltransferase
LRLHFEDAVIEPMMAQMLVDPLTPLGHAVIIFFLFAIGACIGSFLNVVVWRLPRNESLVSPPSHCPRCQHKLAWYDNVPVFGWIMLRGRCRYCREPISIRYPIIEFVTGLLFVFYYVMIYLLHFGPCVLMQNLEGDVVGMQRLGPLPENWPLFALYLLMISALLAASLIDAELFIIPLGIPWLMALAGVVAHAWVDQPNLPGALNLSPSIAALSAGGSVGLLISFLIWSSGRMPISFPGGEPLLETEREHYEQEIAQARADGRPESEIPVLPPPYSSGRIRLEICKELIFLVPPVVLGVVAILLYSQVPSVAGHWAAWIQSNDWLGGVLGALWGGMIGALVIWLTRILGTLGFGRVAMGMGDVHLMFGIGAILGAGSSVIVFFLAPFFGLLMAFYMLVSGSRRELPYGPYLSMAAAFVLLFYCEIAAYLAPGAQGFIIILHNLMG